MSNERNIFDKNDQINHSDEEMDRVPNRPGMNPIKDVFDDYYCSNEPLIKRIQKKNDKLMKDVPTFGGPVAFGGDVSFSNSQFMHNKVQEIIDSSRQFVEMLKKASENRDVDIGDNEHINADSIPSSLVDVHRFIQESGKK